MAGVQSRPAPNTPSHYTDLATSTPTSPSNANDLVYQLHYKKTKNVTRNLHFDIVNTECAHYLTENCGELNGGKSTARQTLHLV